MQDHQKQGAASYFRPTRYYKRRRELEEEDFQPRRIFQSLARTSGEDGAVRESPRKTRVGAAQEGENHEDKQRSSRSTWKNKSLLPLEEQERWYARWLHETLPVSAQGTRLAQAEEAMVERLSHLSDEELFGMAEELGVPIEPAEKTRGQQAAVARRPGVGPRGRVIEGVIVDDYDVACVVPRTLQAEEPAEDTEALSQALSAHASVGLTPEAKKTFSGIANADF